MNKLKCLFNCTIFLIALQFLSGCSKERIENNLPEQAIIANYSAVFEAFWDGIDKNYLYWDIDMNKVDWDKIHVKYSPLFATLNINNRNDLIKGRDYFREMTEGLSDGHLIITFNHPDLEDETINWPQQRSKDRNEKTISDAVLYKKNLKNYIVDGVVYTDPSTNFRLITGSIGKNAAYIHFNYCYIRDRYQQDSIIRKMIDNFFSIAQSSNISTVIIDLRNNNGGDVSDLNFFFGSFVENQTAFGYLKYKQGINRLDYTANLDAFLIPVNKIQLKGKKIICLINGNTVSMAEISALALRSIDNTMFIGQKTFGALGILAYQRALYNAGSFDVGNFMQVKMSSASLSDRNHKNFERIGISPNKSIELVDSEKDTQLEYVIEMIKK